jgi:hypothetical protein
MIVKIRQIMLAALVAASFFSDDGFGAIAEASD